MKINSLLFTLLLSSVFCLSGAFTTGLLQAVKEGNACDVFHWIALGANINTQDDFNSTLLMHAARAGNSAIVEILLEQGAYPDIQDKCGNTALIIATCNNHKDIVEMLLNAGAKVGTPNIYGATASLYAATLNNRHDIAYMLIRANECIDNTCSNAEYNQIDECYFYDEDALSDYPW